jgi:molybdopterin converting factor small subunit
MPTVEVTIPRMLAELVDGRRSFPVEGATVDAALAGVVAAHPELRVHLFDETGAIRQHVSCFHNGAMVTDGDAAVADGDELVILQAVSGG